MQHATRRGFVRGAAMTGAALGLPGILAAGQEDAGKAAWRPRLALSSVMFSGLPLEDFCAHAAKLGFKGIDLWGPFGSCRHLTQARELGSDGFLKLLDRHRLGLAAWTTYRTKGHDEGFPGFAEFIGTCGSGVVVRESKYGSVARDQLEAALRTFFEELKPEIRLARKHKVRLAIENHSGAILDTLESIEIFTRLNPAPEVVGIALAPYHLQARKVPVADAIHACGGQLRFFYAWQLAKGVDELPGHGPADFAPWLRALARQDFRHWMTPFTHGGLPADEMSSAVIKAMRYLNSIAI